MAAAGEGLVASLWSSSGPLGWTGSRRLKVREVGGRAKEEGADGVFAAIAAIIIKSSSSASIESTSTAKPWQLNFKARDDSTSFTAKEATIAYSETLSVTQAFISVVTVNH